MVEKITLQIPYHPPLLLIITQKHFCKCFYRFRGPKADQVELLMELLKEFVKLIKETFSDLNFQSV
jgi:hypothetical protein